MPRQDGTGPMGQGAMTGRGMGICQGNQQKSGVGYAKCSGKKSGKGNGQGMFSGFGRSQNFKSNAPASENDELAFLKQKASSMENMLNNIRQKISELE